MSQAPLVSVVIPTYNRIPQLVNLLQGLAGQSLAPHLFEVIVSDDGSTDPVEAAVGKLDLPYALTCLRNANAGPGAARNRAIERAQALLTLILNDDAVPAPDLLQMHLNAHLRQQDAVAVLGSFPWIPASLARPFVRLVDDFDLIFDYGTMRSGCLYGWRHFWTCNLSLPTQALVAVSGFDERFTDPMCEDVEIGYRLQQIGVPVLYLPEARCQHDHDIDPERFALRQECFGRNLVKLCELHPDPEIHAVFGLGLFDAATVLTIEKKVAMQAERAQQDLETLCAFDAEPLPGDAAESHRLLEAMLAPARRLSDHRSRVGMLEEWVRRNGRPEQHPQYLAIAEAAKSLATTPAAPEKVSIIMPCIDGLEHTLRCLDSIAAHTTLSHEVIVVDNGSSEATLASLRARRDIMLLEMRENIGAPAARNRGLEHATGDAIVFLDNDTEVTPDWIEGFAAHAVANARVGLIGPMSNTVSGCQKVEDADYDPQHLAAYAREFAARRRDRHHHVYRLILFCLYVRRPVIDRIGGFDPAYGRWGFEDDDFCLRAAIAGYALRVAGDVFIHHTGSQTSKAARIDYSQLLRDNWEVFKSKWDIDPDLPYGAPYPMLELLRQPFDPDRHRLQIDTGGSVAVAASPAGVVAPPAAPGAAGAARR